MITITEKDINALYDAIETLTLCCQVLAEGEVTEKAAGSMSWLIGRTARKLGETLTLIETLQSHQENKVAKPTDDALQIGEEVMALVKRFDARRPEAGR